MTRIRSAIVGGGIAALAVAGGAFGAALIGTTANAAPQAAASATAASGEAGEQGTPGGSFDPSKGGHVGQNGVKETLLTGDTAAKAKAAALAAVPGGTIERVETDAEGAKYEAHMVKSDGSHVTVKMDASFKVTGIETGHGR